MKESRHSLFPLPIYKAHKAVVAQQFKFSSWLESWGEWNGPLMCKTLYPQQIWMKIVNQKDKTWMQKCSSSNLFRAALSCFTNKGKSYIYPQLGTLECGCFPAPCLFPCHPWLVSMSHQSNTQSPPHPQSPSGSPRAIWTRKKKKSLLIKCICLYCRKSH